MTGTDFQYQIGYRGPDGSLNRCGGCDALGFTMAEQVLQLISRWRMEGITNGQISSFGDHEGNFEVGFWLTGIADFVHVVTINVDRDEDNLQTLVRLHHPSALVSEFVQAAQGSAKGRKARQLKVLRRHLLPWKTKPGIVCVHMMFYIISTSGKSFRIEVIDPKPDEKTGCDGLDEQQMLCYSAQLLRRRTGD